MKKYIWFLPLVAILFSACGDTDIRTTVSTRSFDESSQAISDRVFSLAKECWENPNKRIADVELRGLLSGETYKTKITQEIMQDAVKIGAHYDVYDSTGDLKDNNKQNFSLITITVNDENNGSKAIIKSFYKNAVSEVEYWLDYNKCR